MPKYLIERELPGAGALSAADLCAIARKSVDVLTELGHEICWQQSFVTTDKIYCVYVARDEEIVREHAKQGGFPANRIERIAELMDPATAET
jgi:hypothetical protein